MCGVLQPNAVRTNRPSGEPVWPTTARLVADELERHLPSPDVLPAEQRFGAAAERDGSRSSRSTGPRSDGELFTLDDERRCLLQTAAP
jgi:hypothetical protein